MVQRFRDTYHILLYLRYVLVALLTGFSLAATTRWWSAMVTGALYGLAFAKPNLCPKSSAGSVPDCFRSAARRSKRQLSQYFSSTDSALLWLRHCAQCLNSPR